MVVTGSAGQPGYGGVVEEKHETGTLRGLCCRFLFFLDVILQLNTEPLLRVPSPAAERKQTSRMQKNGKSSTHFQSFLLLCVTKVKTK